MIDSVLRTVSRFLLAGFPGLPFTSVNSLGLLLLGLLPVSIRLDCTCRHRLEFPSSHTSSRSRHFQPSRFVQCFRHLAHHSNSFPVAPTEDGRIGMYRSEEDPDFLPSRRVFPCLAESIAVSKSFSPMSVSMSLSLIHITIFPFAFAYPVHTERQMTREAAIAVFCDSMKGSSSPCRDRRFQIDHRLTKRALWFMPLAALAVDGREHKYIELMGIVQCVKPSM